MYYTIYKITNLINGKIYIGCHKTKDLNDGYMGSGTFLKRAINKYGVDNFTKDILQVFDKPEDMFEMEAQLVNEGFVKEQSNYNLKIGGQGGWDYLNETGLNMKNKDYKEMSLKAANLGNEKLKYLRENDPEWVKKDCENRSRSKSDYYNNGGIGSFTGKRHTEDSKKKIGEANKIHQKGENNSQYGKMWICNNELQKSKKIYKTDPIPDGWVKGRKIKW